MKTLEEKYHEVAEDKNRWLYYLDAPLNIGECWKTTKTAYDFIAKYFNMGGKETVFNDDILCKNSSFIEERAPHIVSTFLLGIIIAECFEIDTQRRDDNNMSFLYLWFMACLYHDVGYAYEQNSPCAQLVQICSGGIEKLKGICNLQYFEEFWENGDNTTKTYSYEDVDVYLRGRSSCKNNARGVIDHGIVGGLLLYDMLRKNYDRASNEQGEKDNFTVTTNGRSLYYSTTHFDYYAKAANAIIAHNIWLDTLNEYRSRFAPNSCVKQEKPRIYFHNEDDNLAFILSIADTIEPLKRNPQYLKKVSIGHSINGPGFFVQAQTDIFDELYNSLRGLSDWVNVDVTLFWHGDQKRAEISLPKNLIR